MIKIPKRKEKANFAELIMYLGTLGPHPNVIPMVGVCRSFEATINDQLVQGDYCLVLPYAGNDEWVFP